MYVFRTVFLHVNGAWSPDSDELDFFHWESNVMDRGVVFQPKAAVLNLFLTNMQILASQDVNWWTGVVWLYCDVFISCLDSHSDGTHSLQRIHWWAGDGMLHFFQICSDEETKSSTSSMAWGWVHFRKFHFWWTVPLKSWLRRPFKLISLTHPLCHRVCKCF